MIENEKQERAFEHYAAMQGRRSLTKLAKRLGVSTSTVKAWSREFNWKERVAERDRDIATVVRTRSGNTEVESHVRNRQFVQLALVTTARQIGEGKIKATMADLDRLIRLERFLEGEVESRHEIVARELAGKSTEELRQMLRNEVEELKRLTGEEVPPDVN